MRGPVSIHTGGNILLLDFFHIVKASDTNIAIIANFVYLRKTRLDEICLASINQRPKLFMKFQVNEVNSEIKYECHQNCSKVHFIRIVTCDLIFIILRTLYLEFKKFVFSWIPLINTILKCYISM